MYRVLTLVIDNPVAIIISDLSINYQERISDEQIFIIRKTPYGVEQL